MKQLLEYINSKKFNRYKFTLSNDVEGVHRCKFAPDGWADEFVLQRNNVLKGVYRMYSDVTLHFIKDSRDYIKNIYRTQGPNAEINLKVERFDFATWSHVEIIDGVVNLFTLKITDIAAECQIEDDFATAKLMNRKKIDVNLFNTNDLDVNEVAAWSESDTMVLPDQQIQTYNLHQFEGEVSTEGAIRIPFELQIQTFPEAQTVDPSGTIKEQAFFREAQAAYSPIWLSYFLSMHVVGSIQYVARFEIFNSADVLIHTETLSVVPATDGDILDAGSFTYNLSVGDSAHFVFAWSRLGGHSDNITFNTYNGIPSNLGIQAGSELFPEETIKAVHIYDAFERLALLTSGLGFESTFYDKTTGEHLLVTQGKNIRGLDADISVSFEDLAKSSFTKNNTGIGIEDGKVICEHIDHFYSDVVTLDISEKKNSVQLEVMDEYFSSYEIGYTKSTFDAKYGLGEPNTKAEYSTPMNKDRKESNLSPYRGDTTGIIKLRENPTGTSTNDGVSGDDDIWLIDSFDDSGEWTARQNEGFDLAPSGWFNLRYTVRRLIIKHKLAEYLPFITSNVLLQKKDKYSLLRSQETGKPSLVETSDVMISEFSLSRFTPELIICDAPVSIADFNAIDTKGLIKVEDDLYGWIEKVKYNYKTELAEFELLRADLNNVTPS